MKKVKVKVESPTVEDNGKVFPLGHVQEQVRFIEVFLSDDTKDNLEKRALEFSAKYFEDRPLKECKCKHTIDSVSDVDFNKRPFKQVPVDGIKKKKDVQQSKQKRPRTIGKGKRND